jgi:hypothetical protein
MLAARIVTWRLPHVAAARLKGRNTRGLKFPTDRRGNRHAARNSNSLCFNNDSKGPILRRFQKSGREFNGFQKKCKAKSSARRAEKRAGRPPRSSKKEAREAGMSDSPRPRPAFRRPVPSRNCRSFNCRSFNP